MLQWRNAKMAEAVTIKMIKQVEKFMYAFFEIAKVSKRGKF